MIKALKFATIPVRDQDVSLAFYTEKLGFSITTDRPFDESQRWIELRIPGAETGLVLFTPKGHESRIGQFQALSFATDSVEKTYQELSAKGVEFVAPPQRAEWGASVLLKDPDGNQFVLWSR